MTNTRELLTAAYAAFNSRDIDGALSGMHPDVEWANGMEGGFVRGHEGVRAYWMRQWRMIDPRVEPMAFTEEPTGRVAVTVHQIVRDRYSIRNGLVTRMEIGD
jgi:ketosteroid isomerase-like protein